MITRDDLKGYAGNLTGILEREIIENLRLNLPKKIEISKEEFVEISFRPSNAGTRALTISYIVKNLGIPIEVRINEQLEYMQIIIKCAEGLQGYTEFWIDPFSNLMQYLFHHRAELNFVKDEMKRLKGVKKMGGCYSRSYGYSECSRPSIPEWKTTLQEAIKTENREKLTDAYKSFFQESGSSGFIAEMAKLIGISRVEQIPKEFPDIEYEVKFDIGFEGKSEPSIEGYLNAFDFPVARHARFLKDPVHSVATGINRFYGTSTDERLVVITKGGETFLKEKSEILPVDTDIPYQKIVIKRKEKRYEAELDEVINKINDVSSRQDVSYRGRIRKEKGDDFVLDTNDGRIFSFTITRAHLIPPGQEAETAVQRQLEIEYAGFLPGFSGFKENSEIQIIQGMVDLARYTYGLYQSAPIGAKSRIRLIPTLERKYDFIVGIEAKFEAEHNLILPLETAIKGN